MKDQDRRYNTDSAQNANNTNNAQTVDSAQNANNTNNAQTVDSAQNPQIHTPQFLSYADLSKRAAEVAERVRAGGAGALLITEIAPTITMGLRADPVRELTLSEAELQAHGVTVIKTDRGGFATYHGPGQWVVYAIDSLSRLTGDSRGIRRAVEGYLLLASRVAKRSGITVATEVSGCRVGVWRKEPDGTELKLASVGVRLERGVLMHGMALNVFQKGPSFLGLRVCGLDGVTPGYLYEDPVQGAAQMNPVRDWIVEEAGQIFPLTKAPSLG